MTRRNALYNVTQRQFGKLRATLTEYQDNTLKLKITNGQTGATWSGNAAANVWDTIEGESNIAFWLAQANKNKTILDSIKGN